MKLSVIIPTYNEKENLPLLFSGICNAIGKYDYEVVVVDDNSPDGTGELARRISKVRPQVKVLIRRKKKGLASAVLDGLKKAEGDFAAVMDADLQHPPELLPVMIEEAMKGGDLIIASRYVKGGGVEGWNILRRIESKAAIKIAHITVPVTRRVKDPISGYFLYHRQKVDEAELNPIGYKILLEILAKGHFNNIVEVPYTFKRRRKGRSKLNWRVQIDYIKQLLQIMHK